MPKKTIKKEKIIIGWREWAQLPNLKIPHIKVKVDTGARTSSLHAYQVQVIKKGAEPRVRFKVHPFQSDSHFGTLAEAPLLGYRKVRSSSGHQEERPVILTEIRMADQTWSIEVTLTNRDMMGFRMLLGRQALKKRFVVDPGRSFLFKKK